MHLWSQSSGAQGRDRWELKEGIGAIADVATRRTNSAFSEGAISYVPVHVDPASDGGGASGSGSGASRRGPARDSVPAAARGGRVSDDEPAQSIGEEREARNRNSRRRRPAHGGEASAAAAGSMRGEAAAAARGSGLGSSSDGAKHGARVRADVGSARRNGGGRGRGGAQEEDCEAADELQQAAAWLVRLRQRRRRQACGAAARRRGNNDMRARGTMVMARRQRRGSCARKTWSARARVVGLVLSSTRGASRRWSGWRSSAAAAAKKNAAGRIARTAAAEDRSTSPVGDVAVTDRSASCVCEVGADVAVTWHEFVQIAPFQKALSVHVASMSAPPHKRKFRSITPFEKALLNETPKSLHRVVAISSKSRNRPVDNAPPRRSSRRAPRRRSPIAGAPLAAAVTAGEFLARRVTRAVGSSPPIRLPCCRAESLPYRGVSDECRCAADHSRSSVRALIDRVASSRTAPLLAGRRVSPPILPPISPPSLRVAGSAMHRPVERYPPPASRCVARAAAIRGFDSTALRDGSLAELHAAIDRGEPGAAVRSSLSPITSSLSPHDLFLSF
ncbi:hypothetical protein Scep_002244 [Stephania cephalantha]|uniref:Uncharacterized protein n=1 Tax=Stephania cephalantha TaxID=152367 RepID=A0AAP0L9N3_9MAGN